MRSGKMQSAMLFGLPVLSVVAIIIIIMFGCAKKSEPAAPKDANQVTAAAIEQKTCPVMGGAVNPDIFTEYKGKKVYFCCPSCKDVFAKDPEKYITKLPQFQN